MFLVGELPEVEPRGFAEQLDVAAAAVLSVLNEPKEGKGSRNFFFSGPATIRG